MRVLAAGLICVIVVTAALAANAQNLPDPPICTTNLREWSGLASGNDVAAMEGVLARTPNACRELRRQITTRIAELRAATSAPPVQTPARQPADPCARARADWREIGMSTDLNVMRAYRDGLSDVCTVQRAQVDGRITELEGAASQPVTPPTDHTAIELAVWQGALAANTAAAFHDYLRQYPDGRFRVQAEQNVTRLTPQAPGANFIGLWRLVRTRGSHPMPCRRNMEIISVGTEIVLRSSRNDQPPSLEERYPVLDMTKSVIRTRWGPDINSMTLRSDGTLVEEYGMFILQNFCEFERVRR